MGPLVFFRVRDEILPSYILGLFHTMKRGSLLNNQDSMESKTFLFRGSNVLQVFLAMMEIHGSQKLVDEHLSHMFTEKNIM